jgi:hypothetical protein
MKNKKTIEKICGNCLLYNHEKKECKVAVLIEGTEYHLPVFPKDKCHMDQLGMPVQQVRWFVEDENGNPTSGKGTVKIEYPKDFFGKE